MSKIKSLILGSAAGLVAIGGAQAADLPVKAKAVEYVKVCSLYGAGFYYIPGTDTCIRLGGYLRAEVTFNGTPIDTVYLNGTGGDSSRNANDFNSRARLMLQIDTRTATEYGVVRTFAAVGPQFSTADSYASAAGGGGSALGLGAIKVENAFVQFAGFTFGRSYSAYATPWNGYPGNIGSGLWGGPTYDSGVNNVQYTWQFGNGFSASIGADEQSTSNRATLFNLSAAGVGASGSQTFPTTTAVPGFGFYQGNSGADIVGNLKLDQAWGLIQVSAAGHDLAGTYYNGSNTSSGHPQDKWGFAVTGALSLKNLPFGPGDSINVEGTYTEGALKYLVGNSGAAPTNIAVVDGNNFAVAPITDGVYANGTSIQLTKGYGMRGAYNHNWNANWTTSVFGSYSKIDYNGTATTLICSGNGVNTGMLTALGAISCNPDFKLSQVGLQQIWTPVKGLAFYAEGMWTHVDPSSSGTTTATPTIDAQAPRNYTIHSVDQFSGALRVQRNF
ncbi:MAG: porin [Xanthobacteraceae bacterium]|nr:porin [Xanthobacteraceae bacterium]